ncbi:MAG: sulfurtransferase [Proteobacteria bacterium]|nr:sulfurtransferase [Pseudomonadota bacterium]
MFNLFNSLMGSGPAVNAAQAVQAVAEKRALVIDVREEAEVRASGKAKGALNLPLSRLHLTADPNSGHFDKRLAEAKKAGLPLYLYCASGARSGRAAGILRSYGFAEVHNLGTLGAWAQGGGAVQR